MTCKSSHQILCRPPSCEISLQINSRPTSKIGLYAGSDVILTFPVGFCSLQETNATFPEPILSLTFHGEVESLLWRFRAVLTAVQDDQVTLVLRECDVICERCVSPSSKDGFSCSLLPNKSHQTTTGEFKLYLGS